MIILSIAAYLLAGAVAGFSSGLFGIGGGVIMVPALYFLFGVFDYPKEHLMHLAIGTSLATMMLSSFAAMRAHQRKKAILWDVVKKMGIGMTVGCLLGALLADVVSGDLLEIIFGVFLLGLSLMFLKHKTPHLEEHRLPKWPILSSLGLGVGTLASLLGLGGGVFTVPLFTAFRLSPKLAIGTSAALSFLMTTLGTIAYGIINGAEVPKEGTIGFVDLYAFIFAGISAFIAAPFGAACVGKISDRKLKLTFGVFLALVGLSMIIN